MRLVLQRVRSAGVTWEEDGQEQSREIGGGLAILVGAGPEDREADISRLAGKVATLRIFADADGRTNLSLLDVGGAALVVSQFTLYADLRRGRRPSFIRAGDPRRARALYESFVQVLRQRGIKVETGSFGAQMLVRIENDGPVTLAMSTDGWETAI